MEAEKTPLITREKLLVLLKRYPKLGDDDMHPVEMTQRGMSDTLDISRPYIGKELRNMRTDGLVAVYSARIKGCKRRVRVHHLTDVGLKEACRVIRDFKDFIAEEPVGESAGPVPGRLGGESAVRGLQGYGVIPRPNPL